MNSCLSGTTNEGYPSADNRANTINWTTMNVCCCVFGYITVCYQSLTMKAARSGLCTSITSLRIYFLLLGLVVSFYIFVEPHAIFAVHTVAQPNTVYWYNFMRKIPPRCTRYLRLLNQKSINKFYEYKKAFQKGVNLSLVIKIFRRNPVPYKFESANTPMVVFLNGSLWCQWICIHWWYECHHCISSLTFYTQCRLHNKQYNIYF